MPTDIFYRERARYGALRRSRQPNDAELLNAQHTMQAEALVEAINRAMKKAPPMTPELRERVIALLS